MFNEISEFEKALNYKFQDEALLLRALSHSSYANERNLSKSESNERLEFLGDAVLELVISESIFIKHDKMPEGDMTKLRAGIVCEPTLASYARKYKYGDYLLLGRGEESTGGRERDSILSDAFESVLGAIFLDGGFENAKKVALAILGDEVNNAGNGQKFDYKTQLQEIIQRDSKEPLVYSIVSETGPDHDRHFVSEVSHFGKVIGRGEGKTKKESEQHAAKQAIGTLG